MPLTAEQREAIDRRDVSIALSAGAGCGKTHVLTERFLSHLQPPAAGAEPTRLRQLIAITFTDAAAREMRSRIRNACYERLRHAGTDQEQHHWLRLLREIDAARVSTIHAFCAALLRAHAAPAGLDPTFGVMDQADADVLQSEVIDDVLRERLAELDDLPLELAAAYGLARLKQQIAALVHRRHDPAFPKWLAATPEETLARWREWHKREAIPNAIREIAAEAPIDDVMRLLRSADSRGKSAKFSEARTALLELLPRLKKGSITEAELQTIRDQARVQGICNAKDWQPADHYAVYKDACKDLRDVIDKHKPQPFDAECARPVAELGLALLRLTHKVVEQYEDRKRAQGKLDFDDLLSRAYALVSDPKNAELRGQIANDLCLLLVDEFQDTDQLQADLVQALCGPDYDGGRLFFVGDFKQSIYRFRGAEPKVFRDLRADIPKPGRLPLTVNFRSQPAILHFVNALFCDTFSGDGDEYESLRACRPQTTQSPAVEFLWTIAPDKNNRRLPGSALEARRQEARAIARRLRALLDPASTERPIVDKLARKPRQLQPGDVAILFRALSDVQVYEEALREYELDYYLVGGHAFYAQQEIYDVLNLLRSVASTADELSLAGVLRSPFFALEDETLFWLVDTCGSLNAGLLSQRQPPQLSAEERAKVAAAAETIRHLRSIKDRVPIATLLGEALDRTGYDAVLVTEFLGQRKLANMHKLLERARAADHGGTLDLDGFITQLAQFIAQQPKEALAATLPEAADVIRLMTIHHAKGLEFPLVVVPDLDRGPRFGTPPAALDRELGPLVPAPADDEQTNFTTGMTLFAAAERAADLEERQRMLYVACTRAADYLILSSSLEDFVKPKSDWMKLVAERFDLADGQLIARLPPDNETPQVRVTTDPATEYKPVGRSRGPDLMKMLEEAHQLAADGDGVVPATVAAIPVDCAARRQFSFSRLTGQLLRPDEPGATADESGATAGPRSGSAVADLPSSVPVAADLPESSVDPRGLGLLVHDVLARIDFGDANRVAEWCEHLAPLHVRVNAESAAQAARDMIERFVASPHGRRLAEAAAMHREVEFLLAWPPGHGNGDAACLRGYIDCLYQGTDGGWRLADYKTDNVAPADVPRAAQGYEMQLYVYAIAAERALGQPPTELALHFLRPGAQHIFPWNDATRRRAIEMVNRSITELVNNEDSRKGAKAQRQ
ncbi:MAG: UvrD-helicase domain-containing protein [Pirellulales bacterium]